MVDEKICILIIDDEKRMTRVIKDFLKAKGFCVFEAFDGQAGLEVYYENNSKIDLILLDVLMPIMDGFEVLHELRDNEDSVPVIMLTAKTQEYDQLQGFESGADDYICKPFSTSILLARIQNLLKRLNIGADKEFSVAGVKISYNIRSLNVGEQEYDLTPREFDLLDYMVINKGISLSREQLLNNVWGYNFDGDIRTVDTHIKQLRGKLGDCSTCIKTVHRIGYVLEVEQ
ncbi:MAG: response regulator transcription factor [Clostridia bacterium]